MSCIAQNPLLGSPHGGHGGGRGGGHGGGHGGGGQRLRGRFGPNGLPYPIVETACTAWGSSVPMTPDLDAVGKRMLSQSSGAPVSAYVGDVLFRFSYGDGVIVARPCAALSSTLSDAPAPALLYYLYRTANPAEGWVQVGGWMPIDQAEQQMTAVLSSAPLAQLGAYVWDGASMTWKFF
jgi:hypothetical protein